MSNYFKIENLKCSYDKKKVVLEIKKLEIPKGKVIFIVGQSGCGKSTILETLGLMNNTLLCAPETMFVFKPEDREEIDCKTVWEKKNSFLSDIRKKYFSFIFQQTNLMKNFSIKENAVIPQQIKGGKKEYIDILKIVYSKENEWQEVYKKQNVGELSGGQQQRLAFVRAILPNFKIIFGDEPTGNLDSENAENLIDIIKKEIDNNTNKTAIIVSHSPELSEKYADVIIKIHKKEQKTYGMIDGNSVFEKQEEQWSHNGKSITKEELLIKIKE